jgi:hypothetical protein
MKDSIDYISKIKKIKLTDSVYLLQSTVTPDDGLIGQNKYIYIK